MCSHRLRATWKPTFESIYLKIVSDTVSRRDCKSRSSCSTEFREPSKRDRCETRDESRGLFTPPAAIARFPSFRANRRYEQREEREREKRESVSCFGIKLTARARLASAHDEWFARKYRRAQSGTNRGPNESIVKERNEAIRCRGTVEIALGRASTLWTIADKPLSPFSPFQSFRRYPSRHAESI